MKWTCLICWDLGRYYVGDEYGGVWSRCVCKAGEQVSDKDLEDANG